MKKWIFGMAALAAAMCFGATTEDGVTKERRGSLGPNDMVVTDVDTTGIVTARTYTKAEVDRRIETNAPVRSVNGKTGRVVLGAGDVGALPNNRDGLKASANFRNAVWDVQIKPGDAIAGAARILPPYLHEIEFDSTYPDDAEWYYAHADYSDAGMCSVRRTGNVIERNFDWKFDFMPEFVLRTTAAEGRFASLGIASVGKLLSESDVISGKWSPYYRCLPGHTVDGVNEKGVFCEVNVVDGEPDWDNPDGDIHPLGGVRWVLDYGTNAQQAAEALASRIAFPSEWSQNFHYLVADRSSAYIVENGAAHEVTGTAVMTNFKLYPSRDTEGSGQERYDLLADGEPITNAWWTLAYLAKTSPVRVSDIGTDTNAIFNAWAHGDRESHRGQSAGGKTWWQTVHTAVYDLGDLSLRVCVQERGEWYEFRLRVGGGGGVDTSSLRGKLDMTVYQRGWGEWSVSPPSEEAEAEVRGLKPYFTLDPRIPSTSEYKGFWRVPAPTPSGWAISENLGTGTETNLSFTLDSGGPSFRGSIYIYRDGSDIEPTADELATTSGVSQIVAPIISPLRSKVDMAVYEKVSDWTAPPEPLSIQYTFRPQPEWEGNEWMWRAVKNVQFEPDAYFHGAAEETDTVVLFYNFSDNVSFYSTNITEVVKTDKVLATKDRLALAVMMTDAASCDDECVSTNICKLITSHIEPVNPVAEFYDSELDCTWKLQMVDFELRFCAVTNGDDTAFCPVNSVLTDTQTDEPTKLQMSNGELKFFVK